MNVIIEKTIAGKFYGKNAGREQFMAYRADEPAYTGFGWNEAEAEEQLNERRIQFK